MPRFLEGGIEAQDGVHHVNQCMACGANYHALVAPNIGARWSCPEWRAWSSHSWKTRMPCLQLGSMRSAKDETQRLLVGFSLGGHHNCMLSFTCQRGIPHAGNCWKWLDQQDTLISHGVRAPCTLTWGALERKGEEIAACRSPHNPSLVLCAVTPCALVWFRVQL